MLIACNVSLIIMTYNTLPEQLIGISTDRMMTEKSIMSLTKKTCGSCPSRLKVLMGSAFLALGMVTFATAGSAQSVHRDWEAHAKETYCYNVSFPKGTTHVERPYKNYVAVTQRPLESVQDEVSFVSGLNPQADVLGHVKVDNKPARALLVHNGAGFVSSKEEPDLVREMRQGYEMTVTWTYGAGNKVIDTYSLMGFTASREAARRACR